MFGRDSRGNTEEEVYDLFFDWVDAQVKVPQLFLELPELTYSDIICMADIDVGMDDQYYGDALFDLWWEKVYAIK